MSNAFRPLSANEKAQALKPQENKDEGIAVLPVPNGVKSNAPDHHLGTPSMIWDYRDENGNLLYRVARFITPDGEKEDRPLTYRKYKDGTARWTWKSVDAPRPIYGLDRLAKNPDAAVIICEGEKATDAATNLFPDHVAVTSPNGAGSPHKADWTALKDRDVTIWPDNDDEGRKYAEKVSRTLKEAEVKSVRIVTIPDDFEEKWDLADNVPAGQAQDDLEKLLHEAGLVIDPLDNLLERIEADGIGIAYKPEVADALRQLHQSNRPAFMDLRHKLKKAQVGVTFLDKFIQERAFETGDIVPEPDHLDIAREVIDVVGYDNILGSQSHVWLWLDNGLWKTTHDRILKQRIQKYMEDSCSNVMRGKVDAVADVLKTEIHRPEHEWNTNNDTINVLNGELLWDEGKWQLQEHCREHYRTTQVPIAYDPSADCPRFKRFLQEIFDGDPDGDDKAQLILEMIGYTLVSHANFERFILLIGAGANGKSVLMDVIRVLVGKNNVAAVQPSQLDNKFQRAHLHLKLANLVTEIPEGGQIADAELKSITSGEVTTVEQKNKDPFDFLPFATCWFGTNHMPHTRDFTNALFRRALVVPFNNTFKEGVNADPNLKKTLAAELQGILNMALGAFGDVLKRGGFTEPQSCLDAKEEWRKEADQVVQFVEERCVMGEDFEVASGALYADYRVWTDNVGITRKLNKKNFSNRLVRLGCKLHKGTGGKRMIKGIRIGWNRK